MSAAYEETLRVLQLADREDPITELVARKIIEVAGTGERDPKRISERWPRWGSRHTSSGDLRCDLPRVHAAAPGEPIDRRGVGRWR
jgi:hypothetical protein